MIRSARTINGSQAAEGGRSPGRWRAIDSPFAVLSFLFLLALCGCNTKLPEGALVLTQTPLMATNAAEAADILDQRYPAGSRVVLASQGTKASEVRVLSKGLFSAGAPVVCPSGDCIYFAGKVSAKTEWQIYCVKAKGGQPKRFTAVEGGAMDPAIIATGEIVFSSPVPKVGESWSSTNPAALYVQAPGGKPRRLTYGPSSAMEPTVLRDGRILFVSARSGVTAKEPIPDLGLFTINNDGTEVTAFAVNHDGATFVHRPRELLDGRVGFVSASSSAARAQLAVETVRTARPFKSRKELLPFPIRSCRAVEPDHGGGLLVCLETQGVMGRSMTGNFAVFRVAPEAQGLGQPVFDDPSWNEVEALALAPYPNPIGHVTAIMPAKRYGTILCLNADFTRPEAGAGKAAKVRVFTANNGQRSIIGEVPMQTDGSFMAQVPAEIPLGFESLDAEGNTLVRSEPFLWLRPGENRSCIGCHEPYNRTLPNIRPLAASLPPVVLHKGGS